MNYKRAKVKKAPWDPSVHAVHVPDATINKEGSKVFSTKSVDFFAIDTDKSVEENMEAGESVQHT